MERSQGWKDSSQSKDMPDNLRLNPIMEDQLLLSSDLHMSTMDVCIPTHALTNK